VFVKVGVRSCWFRGKGTGFPCKI